MTREEGIFLGGSAGLNVFAALEVARGLDDPDALVVTILCDTGERYLSKLYDDHWMRENQMLEAERMTAGALLARYPREIPPIVSVAPTASVRQALNLMSTWGVSQIPVIDGQDGVGSLSEGPLMARGHRGRQGSRPSGVGPDAASVSGRGCRRAPGPPRDLVVAGDPGRARPQGRPARRHPEPLRRAPAGGGDPLARMR